MMATVTASVRWWEKWIASTTTQQTPALARALYANNLFLEQVRGVEPLSSAWKAEVIPIYDTCTKKRSLMPSGIPPCPARRRRRYLEANEIVAYKQIYCNVTFFRLKRYSICVNDLPSTITNDAHRAKTGDREAFGRLYQYFARPLYTYIIIRVGHRESAEDILGDVWMKAWHAIGRCDPDHVAAWLYTIARHALIDSLRARRPEINWERLPDLRHDALMPAAVDARRQSEKLRAALSALTPEQREVLIMRVWDDLAYEDIARLLGKSVVGCRMLMTRAAKTLRPIMTLASLTILLHATLR